MSTVRCPTNLEYDISVIFINDFEHEKTSDIFEGGTRTTDVEPFCGTQSTTRTHVAFKVSGSTIQYSANTYKYVSFEWISV